MIKYQTEFERYLKGAKLNNNESVDTVIKTLHSVSKHLGFNISTKNLGSNEDVKAYTKQLTQAKKLPPQALKQFTAAMQHYVNMVNGL